MQDPIDGARKEKVHTRTKARITVWPRKGREKNQGEKIAKENKAETRAKILSFIGGRQGTERTG